MVKSPLMTTLFRYFLFLHAIQARQALSEQLRISRQLTETKTAASKSDESDGDEADVDEEKAPKNFMNFGLVGCNSENPWLLNDSNESKHVNEEPKGLEV